MVREVAADLGKRGRGGNVPGEMLYMAGGLFFAGTAGEITPLRSVDKIKIGNGRRGPITEAIQTRFLGIINGDSPDTHACLP